MKTISIKKFETQTRYYSNNSSKMFQLEERDGQNLRFKVICDQGNIDALATAKIISDKNGVREIARVNCLYGNFDLDASRIVPRGRRMSELSLERQAIIDAAIAKDVEIRKKRKELNSHRVLNEYNVTSNGVTYVKSHNMS